MTQVTAQNVVPHSHSKDIVALSYEARFLRRRVLTSASGTQFLLDLPQTTSLEHGNGLELSDGRVVRVEAAQEELLEVRGDHLVRLAWHIGNRHTPCQIEKDRLLIQPDHVIAEMLKLLGAEVIEVTEAFTPEGGAYGHGRTHGHDHSHSHGPHDHSHDH